MNVSETRMYGWYTQWAKFQTNIQFYYDMKRNCVMWLAGTDVWHRRYW